MATFDPTRTYPAAVIGSGSGGLTAAIGLAGFDRDVVLIEGDQIGGDCTNVGCIPSKALLHAAATGDIDALAWARGRRDVLRDEEDAEMANHERIALVRGWGRLTGQQTGDGAHVVAVTAADGSDVEVRAEHVVISTGSAPAPLGIPGLPDDRLLTNETLFDLDAPPARLVCVGGGAISLEMATAFADLGTTVDIVELADRLLPAERPEVSAALTSALQRRGIGVHTGTSVERYDAADDTVHLAGAHLAGVGEHLAADAVLLAVGRRPRLDRLELETAGVEFTSRGITTDDWGRTNVSGIWAIGDATGRTLTTHGANAFGRRTVRAIALPRVLATGSPRVVPAAIYSRPQVASVGMPVADIDALSSARRRRYSVALADLDRGHTDAIEDGVVVVDAERFTGRVLRASIVGPGAADWIGIFTMAIDHDIGLRKMFGMVHPYPAHAEAIGRLADDFARDTYPALPREWWAMARGRAVDALRRR